ncbi:uncharacterized protein F4822DRAFT_414073 [Hypoxylon trugodes]|uniref:uncharacterized protein n=1 Tax=Hypoxylon trugodes TaxID=326681 RepID=UPI002198CD4F|nr:uncharacterized protein F4822DRAFT_414073 [Hypoxylon trugodes]KAI1385746.1 hypothetical protein F4822DRAFT_414073 [Hypoxylon trugodes]
METPEPPQPNTPNAPDTNSPNPPNSLGNRPKEVHTKHLTELERFRVRTLHFDARMSAGRIHAVTGYSMSQIRTAIRAKSAAVPPRTGRPKKGISPSPFLRF